jgi:hypothetical protein
VQPGARRRQARQPAGRGLEIRPGDLRLAAIVVVRGDAVRGDDLGRAGHSRRARQIAAISWITAS